MSPSPSATSTLSLQVVNSVAPTPFPRASSRTNTSMPQEASTSRPAHHSRTGMDAYWPSTWPSSRATQMAGAPPE